MKRSRRVRLIVLAFAVSLTAFAFRGPLFRAVVAAGIDLATGDHVAFDELSLGRASETSGTGEGWQIAARGVTVTIDGIVFGSVARLDATVPGGLAGLFAHRADVRIDGADLRLRRDLDGALVPHVGNSGGGGSGGRGWDLTLRVEHSRLAFEDPSRRLADARRASVEGLHGDARLVGDGAFRYGFAADMVTEGRRDPFRLAGRAWPGGRDAVHRLRAAALPAAAIADFFINTESARALGGAARDVDVVLYRLPNGYHVAGGGTLDGVGLRIPGLRVPAEDMRGRLDLSDAGLAAPDVRARLGDVPVRIEGGLVGWSGLALRLGVTATTTLADLRGTFAFSRALPIRGDARVAAFVEGGVGEPLVIARLTSTQAAYGAFPIDGLAARVLYAGGTVDVLPARGRYGRADVLAYGTIALGDVAHPRIYAGLSGPAAAVPYAAQAAPDARLIADGYLEGDGIALDAEGDLAGSGTRTTLGGLFHLDRHGDGAYGPLLVRRDDGARIAGTLFMNRSANQSAFWVAASGFPSRLSEVTLPGLPGFGPPPFSGTLDGAVVGGGPPSAFRLAGTISGRDLDVAHVRIAHVRGQVTGTFGALALAGVTADGPWGRFAGTGRYADRELAVEGDYHGGFGQLESLGARLGGTGTIDGPVALVLGPTRTVVQARGDRAVAAVAGVPVESLSGTFTVRGKRVDVLAADVGVPGADLALAGTLGRDGGLGVSVAGVDARRLRATGSPLDAGRVVAIGEFGQGEPGRPRFHGGVALAQGRLGSNALAGDADVDLARGAATLGRAAGVLDGAYGQFDGRVAGFDRRAPLAYDLGVRLREVPLAPFARRAFPADAVAGSLDGDLHVAGRGSSPAIDGTLAVRAGSLHGQFIDELAGRLTVGGGATQVAGDVRVGSTAARFAFGSGDDAVHARLVAPSADLADFNDLFDQGDVLGGTGRVDVFFAKAGPSVSTSADVNIGGLRYRGFDLGDAVAHWSSTNDRVAGTLAFGGSSGRLAADGVLTLASRAPLDRILQRSRFDGAATLAGLELGTWLPAVGYAIPVTGRVDAEATVHGSLTAPLAVTHARLTNGSFGKFPIDRFEIAATSDVHSTTIQTANLDLLSVSASASGTLGFSPSAPLALHFHATGGDLGAVAAKVFGGGRIGLSGSAETDVTVSGTRGKPKVIAGFDVEKAAIGGVAIPRALGEVSLEGRDLVLSGAELSFAKGELTLAGSLPLQLEPFSIGPESAPLALDVAASGIDLTDFASLLPAGSTLRGRLDGRVALGGTVGTPRLRGTTTVAGGVLESPFERERLSNIAATLDFRERGARLVSLHAEAGGGSLDASGRIRFADLTRPTTDGSYTLEATAKALKLDLPEFGRGTVDGSLRLAHEPGELPTLTAAATLQDGVIPFSALLLAAGSTSTGPPSSVVVPPVAAGEVSPAGDVRLALALTAGRNVRVRSGNVDIGGRGVLTVAGTRSAPSLSGGFESTGGTLTYFNTLFRVQRGTVTFQPDSGVVPYLRAVATTHVTDPDPNPTRNLSGFADISLDITGPVTNLAINLTSDPPYGREQILGLLLSAPELGATNLFDPNVSIQPLGVLPAGQTGPNGTRTAGGFEAQRPATAPGDIFATTVGEEAFGVVNAQFTRNLLAPFENAFSDAVGLSAVNINVDYTGNVGLTARKILGKTVNAIYATTFGYPYRQSVGFELRPTESTAAQVTVFQTIGNEILGLGVPNTIILPANSRVGAGEPAYGTIGFSLSVQRFLR